VIGVVVGDLASVDVDAVVRPATHRLEPIPELRDFDAAAGQSFQEQIRTTQTLGVGAAVVTAAGQLATEFVIHAVIQGQEEPISGDGIRRTLLSALQRAKDWQFTRLATPLMCTAQGSLVTETTAEIMAEVLIEHLQEQPYPSDVMVVVATEEEKAIFESCLRRRGQ
jgi:O-acetyl-ADP-ribose deacetylase (regulator of RNase III)